MKNSIIIDQARKRVDRRIDGKSEITAALESLGGLFSGLTG